MAATSAVQARISVYSWMAQAALVVGATLFIAACARISLPLPFTPVPLTLANFAVLLVGMTLGARRGFAALCLYLAEGAAGLPVFSVGPGGIAQLLGPTGGYLISYPFAALIAGFIAQRARRSFARLFLAALIGDMVLLAAGVLWLMVIAHLPFSRAAQFGAYPFLFAEVVKIMMAAAAAQRLSAVRAVARPAQ